MTQPFEGPLNRWAAALPSTRLAKSHAKDLLDLFHKAGLAAFAGAEDEDALLAGCSLALGLKLGIQPRQPGLLRLAAGAPHLLLAGGAARGSRQPVGATALAGLGMRA